MPKPQTTILITGFGPFPGTPENASTEYASCLAAAACDAFPNARIINETLPTQWAAAPKKLRRLIHSHKPGLMLLFGVSDRATGLQIETQAVNSCAIENDACGALPASEKICDDGPSARLVTLPFKSILTRLDALRIPASLSNDAGIYLCNASLYEALAHCGRARRAGFIHLPTDVKSDGANLDWDHAITGGMEVIRACLDIKTTD